MQFASAQCLLVPREVPGHVFLCDGPLVLRAGIEASATSQAHHAERQIPEGSIKLPQQSHGVNHVAEREPFPTQAASADFRVNLSAIGRDGMDHVEWRRWVRSRYPVGSGPPWFGHDSPHPTIQPISQCRSAPFLHERASSEPRHQLDHHGAPIHSGRSPRLFSKWLPFPRLFHAVASSRASSASSEPRRQLDHQPTSPANFRASPSHLPSLAASSTSAHLPSLAANWITMGHQFTREGARGLFQNGCPPSRHRIFDGIIDWINVTTFSRLLPGRQLGQTRTDVWSRHRAQPTQLPHFSSTRSTIIKRRGALTRRP